MLAWGSGAAGAATPPPAPAVLADHTFDYESGTEGWTAKKDGRLRDGDVTWSSDVAKSGAHSLDFWLDGRRGDGTLWVERAFPVPQGQPGITVELSVWEWNGGTGEAAGWPVVAHADRAAPAVEEDFVELGRTDFDGWRQYTYSTTIDVHDVGTFYVAFGLSADKESPRAHYFDLASVTVT
ncbi:hypothetical protein AGRA3207_001807 [Actinomadura graeca]|uniref:Uncharacterized protein n=1 Tax=Actinomadura graeca TaxID=2750812 RepID=A0ABX8QQT7_9ACTN|nr:hypothetical protein [Actinomadura graeca]QXJ21003.1 hypothetical protein AGRA3207_001807 [Actinomadura graeca]